MISRVWAVSRGATTTEPRGSRGGATTRDRQKPMKADGIQPVRCSSSRHSASPHLNRRAGARVRQSARRGSSAARTCGSRGGSIPARRTSFFVAPPSAVAPLRVAGFRFPESSSVLQLHRKRVLLRREREWTILRPMFGVFVSVLQLATIVNAFARSIRERFLLGTLGALGRGVLLVAAAIGVIWVRFVHFPGSDVPAPAGPTLVALAATVLGPILSFVVLWVAHRRRRDVPAAEEERLSRPFMAWLPVALFDAALVFAQVFAWVMTKDV